ncbi:ABC transporter substrate-binding protein [Litoribrevibacter euphylliae]|uniref:ABC transporter substrate-binding protein n=1 Tax=Litoribrevibacter euphylliae TaxID=1834034 RepID=A0ABV7HF63_9GAMM
MLLIGCSKEEPVSSDSAPQDASYSMRLSIDLWPGYYPAIIAKEKGWFKDAGLNLKLDLPGNTDKMLALFSAGSIDAVAVAFGDAILVTRQMPDIAVILVTDESAGGDAVLSMNKEVLSDLKGKRIGTNLGGFGELLIRRMLDLQGVKVNEVNLVNVDASKVPDLLDSGGLDVGHTWSPYVGQAIEKGANIIFSSADTPGLIPDTVAVSGEFRRSKPEAVKIFLDVWFKAQNWWLTHYQEGNQLIAEATGQRVTSITLEGIRLLDREANVATFNDATSEQGLPNVLKTYNEFYARAGVIRTPAAPSILASEFLQ